MNKYEKPTDEQVAKWKERHEVFELDISGHECWVRFPSLTIMKSAVEALMTSVKKYEESLSNNCWLVGEEIIKTDEELFDELCSTVASIVKLNDFELERVGSHYLFTAGGYSCRLKKPTRDEVSACESRNKKQTPFMNNIYLLEKVWIDGDEILRKDDRFHLTLLTAVEDMKNTKLGTVKKR